MPCQKCGEPKVCLDCVNDEASAVYHQLWQEQASMFNQQKEPSADAPDTSCKTNCSDNPPAA